MDFAIGLQEKVKRELNHIYTERPPEEGGDFGWFCREHALYLFGVAMLLGKNVEICTGDVMLRRSQGRSFYSGNMSNGHAWCSINGVAPVDVSITVKHVYPDLPDIKLIYGERADLAAPFHLRYLVQESAEVFLRLGESADLLVGYNEANRSRFDLMDLLAHPFQFLHKPPPGMRTFPEIHGRDVFFAITYHCYRLLTEDRKPLASYRDPKRTVQEIVKRNADAQQRIAQLLA